MPITDIITRNAKPKDKPYKISDEKGLYLYVKPNGGRYWRYKYYFGGKEKVLALGVYPEISLKEAREKRDEARKIHRDGIDPSQDKKEKKLQYMLKHENNFLAVALEWHEVWKSTRTPKHASAVLRRLEKDVFPELGARPVNEISAPELLAMLRKIETRGALDITHRAMQTCGQIFRYAIITGRAKYNPTIDLRGALKSPGKSNHAYLEAAELPEFLSKLRAYDGHIQTRLAMDLLLLTFVRTTELRAAKWEEINLEKAEWRIPAERMKMREQHIVPLSRQAIEIIEEVRKLTGHCIYVFPSQNNLDKFMSENTMLYALYRLGYHSRATIHGFRATASTILNEHGFRSDVIERQLAHGERNQVRAAYNHAQHLPERRQMMQWWADYLEGLSGNGKVVKVEFGKVG